MNKHAYLIIAHHEFELLEMIIKLLDFEQNDIYIHIDKRLATSTSIVFSPFRKIGHFLYRSHKQHLGSLQRNRNRALPAQSRRRKELFLFSSHFGVDLPLKTARRFMPFSNKTAARNLFISAPRNLQKDLTPPSAQAFIIFSVKRPDGAIIFTDLSIKSAWPFSADLRSTALKKRALFPIAEPTGSASQVILQTIFCTKRIL